MQTIIVTDQKKNWLFATEYASAISASDYLSDPQYFNSKPMRILNLCKNYGYQSIGYYVSLLAEARNHKVAPSVATVQDLKNSSIIELVGESIQREIQKDLKSIKSDEFILSVYFGKNMAKKYSKLCYKLYGLFPLPLFRVVFKRRKDWQIKKCTAISIKDVPKAHMPFLESALYDYMQKKRFTQYKNKKYAYDLAILVDAEEKTPPSNHEALERFIHASSKLGINAEIIEKEQYKILAEYDALFIRETTSVNHHTYKFSRRAAQEGLVVLDDPESILKCGNKVYLAELLTKHNIPCPKSYILSKHNWKEIYFNISLPCVLKLPDSAFSQGVVKVNQYAELKATLARFFKDSDLIIAQTFMPTEFDWRVGVLDKQPIFACRYYMAKGHWQIYNWDQTQISEGKDESVPIEEVPPKVLELALKSVKLIGDGLYGVDIKQSGKNAYVIEINDNPNIDYGIEDKILGDDLYLKIANYFLQRMQKKHGHK